MIFILATYISLFSVSYAAATEEATVIAYRIDPPQNVGNIRSSYFIGTIGLSSTAELVLPSKICDYLTSCKTAVFESRSIAGRLDQDTMRERLMQNFNIEKLYKPEFWTIIVEKCKKADLEIEYTPLKPWAIFFMLIGVAANDGPDFSISKNLFKLAKRKKMNITFLESDAAYLFDRIPLEIQLRHVEKAIENMKSITDHLKNIEGMYLRGEINELAKASRFNSTDRQDVKMELLWNMVTIDGKIDLFMELIEKHISSGNVFVSVSAETLPGENGILARLRAKGYTVTDVSVINRKLK